MSVTVLPIPPQIVTEAIRYPRVVPRWDRPTRSYQYAGERPWSFQVEGAGHDVPIGYVFDGASVLSVTGLFWVMSSTPGDPRVLWAAMEHDWLCDTRPPRTPYDAAARRFHEVLLWCRLSPVRAKLMYQAVLRFGPRW